MSNDATCDRVWPKRCNMCKAEFSVDDWEGLTYIGLTRATGFGFDADLEHRLCNQCGNDMTQTCVSRSDIIKVA